jgi:hypothetical protein
MNYTVEELKNIVAEATQEARIAAADAYQQNGNSDWDACGFAWVSLYGIKGNTKLGKALRSAGVEQSYDRSYQIWGGKFYSGQSITIKEQACRAAAAVFRRYGFDASVGSRLD